MITLYEIVPKNNGYDYLGLDEKNNIVLFHKATPINTSLMFKNKEDAESFIEINLDKDMYKVEGLLLNEKYYKDI